MVNALIFLQEVAETASGFGPELVAFIAGSGGTMFTGGIMAGKLLRRLDDVEKKAAEAAAACKEATAHNAKIAELENRLKLADETAETWRRRTREIERLIDGIQESLRATRLLLKHGDSVPREVLDDISETFDIPRDRNRDLSQG